MKREIHFRGKIFLSYYIFLKTLLHTAKLGEHKKFGRALPPNDHTTCGSGLTLNTVEAAQSTWRRMHDARTGCAPSKAPRYIYTYGANKVTGVSMACDLYFCFLALCEVLRTCPSGIRPQQYYMLFITNNHVAYFIKFHFFCIKCYVILWKLKLLHISSLSFSGPRYSILPFGVQFFVHCLSSNISGCSFC